MHYDFALIEEFCQKAGISCVRFDERIELQLGGDAVLYFSNEKNDDCAVGFMGTPWHCHGDFMFADARGNYVELNYLDALSGLKDGKILICELWKREVLGDRWLVHCDYNDVLKYMEDDEEIKIRRSEASVITVKSGPDTRLPARRYCEIASGD